MFVNAMNLSGLRFPIPGFPSQVDGNPDSLCPLDQEARHGTSDRGEGRFNAPREDAIPMQRLHRLGVF